MMRRRTKNETDSRSAPLPRPHPLSGRGSRRILHGRRRYQVCCSIAGSPEIVVTDLSGPQVLFRWSGSTARHLIDHRFVPDRQLVDKQYVQHLAMVAASVEATEQCPLFSGKKPEAPENVGQAVARGGLLKSVIELLHRYREHHFSRIEVASLLALENRPVEQSAVDACLAELVERGDLQRIDVPGGKAFFDTTLEPHLHIYDPTLDAIHDVGTAELLMADTGHSVVVIPVTDADST